jgi:hypothetical protein
MAREENREIETKPQRQKTTRNFLAKEQRN